MMKQLVVVVVSQGGQFHTSLTQSRIQGWRAQFSTHEVSEGSG